METSKIPAKSEWRTLSVYQLYDVRAQMIETYQGMRRISASFAPQYLLFIAELDSLIRQREVEAEAEKESS